MGSSMFGVWRLVKEQPFARKGRDGVGTREPGTGDVVKWQGIRLAHARPWVQSPAPREKIRKEMCRL